MTSSALRILAVEDNPAQQQALRLLLPGLGYELVGIAASAEEALTLFAHTQPDLVLLDVNLAPGQRDGIDVAHEIVRLRPVPLIFLTAYPDQHTFERARRVGPFAFLGKPYGGLLLGHSIELAVQHFATAQGLPPTAVDDGVVLLGGVFVREQSQLLKVPLDSLLVAEADASYTHLHTPGRKFTIRTSLRELEDSLPTDRFVRIHRAYLVQLSRVEAFDYVTSTLRIGTLTLPLGRTHRDEVLSRLRIAR